MQRLAKVPLLLTLFTVCLGISYGQQGKSPGKSSIHPAIPSHLIKHKLTVGSKQTLLQGSEKKFVRFVYLVPADSVVKPHYKLAIENAARHLQLWYKNQLGNNQSFNLHEPVVEVYQTTHESNWYSINPEGDDTGGVWKFWANVVDDGFSLTGGSGDPDNFYIFYIDALPACPLMHGGATINVAAVGANDLRGLVGKSWIPICDEIVPDYSPCRYVGGIGHELGHTFGLPHPPGCDDGQPIACDYQSIMFTGYLDYPNCYFSENEKAALLASPFISEVNISNCAIDCGNLSTNYTFSDSVEVFICDGSTYFAGGSLQTDEGTYYDSFVTAKGCDSVIVTRLKILPTYEITKDVSICKGKTYRAGGSLQTTAGMYYDSFLTAKGCDSVIVTRLKILPTYEITKDVSICKGETYLAGGSLQTNAGTYYDSFLTAKGCDSVIVTRLKILPSFEITKDVSICKGETYLAGGSLQTNAGTYYDSFLTAKGCDSLIVTHLEILPTYEITKDASICKGETYLAGGSLQTNAGTYYDSFLTAKGCDSVIVTRLKILPSFEITKDATICKGDTYFAGGSSQTVAGTYYDSFLNTKGCDSIIVTRLKVVSSYEIIKDKIICQGQSYLAGGIPQTAAGTYYDPFLTALGCDSIIVTHLKVLPSYEITIDVTICEGETYFAGGSLQTAEGTYLDNLVTMDGCDSVIVTKLTVGICTAISAAIDRSIKIYPVPTNGILYIQSDNLHHEELFNSLGQQVLTSKMNYIDFSALPEGYYYLRIFYSANQFVTKRVVFTH